MARRQNKRSRYAGRGNRGRKSSFNWTRFGLVVAAVMIVFLAITGSAYTVWKDSTTEKIAANYCWRRDDQSVTAVAMDASFTADISSAQVRDYRTGLERIWREAEPNTRIEIFTTAKGQSFSVAAPVFTICKPPMNALEQTGIGAPKMQPNRLLKIYEDAEKSWSEGIDEVLETTSDAARAASHSPILEMLSSISRYSGFSGPDRQLVAFTDGIQNSPELGQFCVQQGHMPSYARFKDKPEFSFYAPRFQGASVQLYLVEHGQLPSGSLKFCSNVELRNWWQDYFQGNGVSRFDLLSLRYWED